MPDMTLSRTTSPREQLKQIAEQKQYEAENSLLKAALTESSEKCEESLKKCTVLLQTAEQNRQRENELRQSNAESKKQLSELNNSVSKLKNVNQELSNTIAISVANLVNQVRTATVGEVKDALRTTNDTITQSCAQFKNQLTAAGDTAEERMKATANNFSEEVDKINKALDEKLHELESKQRQFFMFDGAKHVFFWLSQVVSLGTFALLIYFLFFKK